MNARYRWGKELWCDVPVERRNSNPSYRLPARSELRLVKEHTTRTARVLIYQWPDFVEKQQVRSGIALLRKLMYHGDVGRIMIPLDVQRHQSAV